MNVDDLISRATHTTGRTLLAVSSTILLAAHFKHKLENFPILVTANSMPEGMVEVGAFALILYLIIAHLLNWFTDKFGFDQGELIKIYNKQKELDESADVIVSESSKGASEVLSYEGMLLKFKRETTVTLSTQYMSLYGQHLLLPVIVGLFSLVVLYPITNLSG